MRKLKLLALIIGMMVFASSCQEVNRGPVKLPCETAEAPAKADIVDSTYIRTIRPAATGTRMTNENGHKVLYTDDGKYLVADGVHSMFEHDSMVVGLMSEDQLDEIGVALGKNYLGMIDTVYPIRR